MLGGNKKMEILVSEKEFLEKQIETAQRNIWNIEIEIRLLERAKLSVGQSKLVEIENAISGNKNLVDNWEKRQEVLKDRYKELTGEELKITTK